MHNASTIRLKKLPTFCHLCIRAHEVNICGNFFLIYSCLLRVGHLDCILIRLSPHVFTLPAKCVFGLQ